MGMGPLHGHGPITWAWPTYIGMDHYMGMDLLQGHGPITCASFYSAFLFHCDLCALALEGPPPHNICGPPPIFILLIYIPLVFIPVDFYFAVTFLHLNLHSPTPLLFCCDLFALALEGRHHLMPKGPHQFIPQFYSTVTFLHSDLKVPVT